MKLGVAYDADWESGLDKVLNTMSEFGYRTFFEKKVYGTSLDEIFIVLMCRNPKYNFKQRIRFSKKDKILYADIMLDLNQFKKIDQKEKEKFLAGRLIEEIPLIILKYKFADFDTKKFSEDLKYWFRKIKWY